MAEVRHARDLRLNRDVAIKQLRIDLASDPTFQERFRREAQAAANLNHPNIVAVYDTGSEPDPTTGIQVPYIVMELVEGHTLREILRTGRQIQPAKALEFTAGVLDALAYSHKAGIVHRDIKPANVMLTSDGTIKVMDFGIARAVADTSSTMTQTAAVIGTAQYLSPEQARGESVDARSDIYSTGCLLYELLVGRPPFTGDSPVSVAYQHVREAPTPPSELDPMVTAPMDAVVLKSLAKDPAERYQTAGAMRADIGRLLAGQNVLAKPRPAVQLPASAMAATQVVPAMAATGRDGEVTATRQGARAIEPEPRRHTGMWAFVIALVVLALGFGGYLVYYNFLRPDQVTMVSVPTVQDLRQAAAEEALTQAGLKAVVVNQEGADDDTVGRVVSQDPLPNASVPLGSEVQITVNRGPTKGQIPVGLLGQNYKDVVAQLGRLGFTNVTAKADPNEPLTAKKNQTTVVDPPEGSSVAVDTAITISYATGMSPVPDVYSRPEAVATSMLTAAGFQVIVTPEEKDNWNVGTVFDMDPAAGTQWDRTKKVTIYIAVAPPPPPPPTSAPPTEPTTEPPTAPPT